MKLKKYITEKNVMLLFIGMIVITTIADIYSALTSPVFFIAETNPIYILTGSVVPLLVINALVVVWITINLRKSISITKIFVICMITVYLTLGHGFGVWSNISATNDYEEHPDKYIQMVQEYDTNDKIMSYLLLVGIVMIMPIVVSMIAFIVAMYFYEKRQGKRNRIITKIWKLSRELKNG